MNNLLTQSISTKRNNFEKAPLIFQSVNFSILLLTFVVSKFPFLRDDLEYKIHNSVIFLYCTLQFFLGSSSHEIIILDGIYKKDHTFILYAITSMK